MGHLLAGDNVSLITSRLTKGETFKHVQASRHISEVICMSSKTSNNGFVFPLYLYPNARNDELQLDAKRSPNFARPFLNALAATLKLTQEREHGLPKGIEAEDIFRYIYGVLHSRTYRARYGEFLKGDFPRIPLTSDIKLFRAVAAEGANLVALHLMESPALDELLTEFPKKGSNEVEKVQYSEGDKRVWINSGQYFGGVPKAIWEFQVGGYQVCEKWLKDRKRRKLSYAEIQHYQRIVVALSKTTQTMDKLEAVIPRWPIA
jgi:predicted helicase